MREQSDLTGTFMFDSQRRIGGHLRACRREKPESGALAIVEWLLDEIADADTPSWR